MNRMFILLYAAFSFLSASLLIATQQKHGLNQTWLHCENINVIRTENSGVCAELHPKVKENGENAKQNGSSNPEKKVFFKLNASEQQKM